MIVSFHRARPVRQCAPSPLRWEAIGTKPDRDRDQHVFLGLNLALAQFVSDTSDTIFRGAAANRRNYRNCSLRLQLLVKPLDDKLLLPEYRDHN